MTNPKKMHDGVGRDLNRENLAVTVAATGETTLIPKTEIFGMRGHFIVDNGSANTITVFPRVSVDGTNWVEMDNGTGSTLATLTGETYPWIGSYRYVMCVATAGTASTPVDAYLYVSYES